MVFFGEIETQVHSASTPSSTCRFASLSFCTNTSAIWFFSPERGTNSYFPLQSWWLSRISFNFLMNSMTAVRDKERFSRKYCIIMVIYRKNDHCCKCVIAHQEFVKGLGERSNLVTFLGSYTGMYNLKAGIWANWDSCRKIISFASNKKRTKLGGLGSQDLLTDSLNWWNTYFTTLSSVFSVGLIL